MQHVLHIDCPPELLLSLHMNAEEMADWTKAQAAIALYEDSGICFYVELSGQAMSLTFFRSS